jgi:hypothetical protein
MKWKWVLNGRAMISGSIVWRRVGITLATGGLLLGVFLNWLFPLPEGPPLPGPYAVGTLSFEILAEEGSPGLVAQAWYPAKSGDKAAPARWLPDPALAPKFPFHRIGGAFARSLENPTPADTPARFPVIFYEHSWTGHRAENVAQVENLASRGFAIIAVDHPGQAARVKYANGTVVLSRLPAELDFSTQETVLNFEKWAEPCLRDRAANLARVRRALDRGAVPRLAGRLDLEKSGVFGFSFGGTSALRLCAVDPSFVAGADEDGLFLGDQFPQGPFLFFDEEMPGWLLKEATPVEGPGEALIRESEARILAAMKKTGRFRQILDGTRHESFTDRIFICRIPRLARVGTRPAAEIHRIITNRLADFFIQQLPPAGPAE